MKDGIRRFELGIGDAVFQRIWFDRNGEQRNRGDETVTDEQAFGETKFDKRLLLSLFSSAHRPSDFSESYAFVIMLINYCFDNVIAPLVLVLFQTYAVQN